MSITIGLSFSKRVFNYYKKNIYIYTTPKDSNGSTIGDALTDRIQIRSIIYNRFERVIKLVRRKKLC